MAYALEIAPLSKACASLAASAMVNEAGAVE